MELLAKAGIAPLEVIAIATSHGAAFLGMEDRLGKIAPGMLADLVLLDADPVVDIDNAKAISLVIKNGAIVDRARLNLAGTASP